MKQVLLSLFVAGLLITGWMLDAALAHDPEHPELNSWYHGLHSRAQTWCCEGDDATHLADTDWESRDGHYRVRIEGQWWDVPDGAVIDTPNRDGRTLVWPVYNSPLGGPIQVTIRCFMPGSMT